MKNLKLFETDAEYQVFAQDYTQSVPNVAYVEQTEEVHYNEEAPEDPYGGHAYVEIAGLKWATMNIGATDPTKTGMYFQWGDTQGYTEQQIQNGDRIFDSQHAIESPMESLTAANDAATVNWGSNWRMPTKQEIEALIAATDIDYGYCVSTGNEVEMITTHPTVEELGTGSYAFRLRDKTDPSKYLIFPAAGFAYNNQFRYKDTDSWCLSSEGDPEHGSAGGFALYTYTDDFNVNAEYNEIDFTLSLGFTIRPVAD